MDQESPQDDLKEEIDLFRLKLPSFKDTAAYPDERIFQQLILTSELVSKDKWPNPENKEASLYWYARFLITAHNLILEDNAVNPDGTAVSNTDTFKTSKSVGGVSVSYSAPDQISGSSSGSTYETTTYGRKYLTLVKIFGSGCIAI